MILVLALLPWRGVRRAVALVFGAFVVAALVFAGLDAAFEYALNTHFDASDWPQVGDGFGVVRDSIGAPARSRSWSGWRCSPWRRRSRWPGRRFERMRRSASAAGAARGRSPR